MKKLVTLLFLITPFMGFSQTDTLLYENFDVDPTANYLLVNSGNDTVWVDFDVDQNADANGRPVNWFWSDAGFSAIDVTGCLFSSSWFTSVQKCQNYLITPPIDIVDANAVLHWSAAPRQTPSFCDGYKVLVSTTDNLEPSFTDTIYVSAEFLSSTGADSTFASFSFSSGFVHGLDGTYIEYSGDSTSFIGQFRPFSVSLAAYSGQTVYIAFLHDSEDDNLIGVDDILLTGSFVAGIKEQSDKTKIDVSPNPASNNIHVKYNLPGAAQVSARLLDEKGSLVASFERGMQLAGDQVITLDLSGVANGKYFLQLVAGKKVAKTSFIVAK